MRIVARLGVTFVTMGFLFQLAEAAKQSLGVDLLAPERLAALGRAGLHGSHLFIVVAAVASLSGVGTGGSAIEFDTETLARFGLLLLLPLLSWLGGALLERALDLLL